MDPDAIIHRLEEAGATLLALPAEARSKQPGAAQIVLESHDGAKGQIRPPVPSAGKIARMNEAFGWLTLIPVDRYVLRRVVGARALVHPLTDRHLFPWRRLGRALGTDHKAAQRWHAQGIDLIACALSPETQRDAAPETDHG
jgi:hypothetical protein